MINWTAEPHWRWFDEMLSPVRIMAADVLLLGVQERAYPPRPPVEKSFRNLDRLKSDLKVGVRGVILGW